MAYRAGDSTVSEAQSLYSLVLSQLREADTGPGCDRSEHQKERQNEALGEPEWRADHSVKSLEESVKTFELILERKAQIQSTGTSQKKRHSLEKGQHEQKHGNRMELICLGKLRSFNVF